MDPHVAARDKGATVGVLLCDVAFVLIVVARVETKRADTAGQFRSIKVDQIAARDQV